jgi:hypothetical protein
MEDNLNLLENGSRHKSFGEGKMIFFCLLKTFLGLAQLSKILFIRYYVIAWVEK